jgi:hypothetical protein
MTRSGLIARALFGSALIKGAFVVFALLGLGTFAFAQEHPSGAAATPPAAAARPRVVRPPLFLDENWKQPTVPVSPTDHAWPSATDQVASENLTLQFYGTDSSHLLLSGTHQTDINPLNFWNGVCNSPIAVTLRDKDNYVDLTGLAKIHWTTRTSGFHVVRPVVKLADGTYLVGDVPSGQRTDFDESEVSFSEIRWIKLDPMRVVTTGNWVENPDLSKVDEVGYADLIPGSGHGNGGWVNVGHLQVYGKPVKR